jgi:gliding motility-associated-like protein
MNYTRLLILCYASYAVNIVFASAPCHARSQQDNLGNALQFGRSKTWNFIENKGQLGVVNGSTPNGIKYYGRQGAATLFCMPGRISFVFTKAGRINNQVSEASGAPLRLSLPKSFPANYPRGAYIAGGGFGPEHINTTCRADLVILQANLNAHIIASEKQEYYENYYAGNIAEGGITCTNSYTTITYKSIYPHIDLVLNSAAQGLKYEFVVYPGGRVSDIKMQWNGLTKMAVGKDGGISYYLKTGKITEEKPVSFQAAKKIKTVFYKHDNILCFKIDRYDRHSRLLIDPTLTWGTYFGGTGTDYGSGVAVDKDGNVYLAGGTKSLASIASSGAYLTTYGSDSFGYTGYLAKFNSSGKIQWATYFGDSLICTKLAADRFGNVYVTGSTNSRAGIATNGAYQNFLAGPHNFFLIGDAFIVKFDGKGLRQWGTYFGGAANDIGNAIATDTVGNIYITGETNSSSGIATNGAYQINPGVNSSWGPDEAFLAKFNSKGTIQWATYYGYAGSPVGNYGTTAGICLSTDKSGNIYMAGFTQSASGIATSGAYMSTFYHGTQNNFINDNGFIAKFNTAGVMGWGTYFGDFSTVVQGIACDDSGNVIVTGNSTDTTIATIGKSQKQDVGSHAFVAKIKPTGERYWTTFYGGTNQTETASVTTDRSGNIYLLGVTSSTSGIATAGAYQRNIKAGTEKSTFLARFSQSGSLSWGTYFGMELSNSIPYFGGGGGQLTPNVSADIYGHVYFTTGTVGNDSGLATKHAYHAYYAGKGDAFLARFSTLANDAGIDSVISSGSSLCSDTIQVALHNYGVQELDSVNIFISANHKTPFIYHWHGKLLTDSALIVTLRTDFLPGIDSIKVWTHHPNGVTDTFPLNDTASIIRTVFTRPKAIFDTDPTLYIFEKNPVSFLNQSTSASAYLWSFGNNDNSNDASPMYVYSDTGNFRVKLVSYGHGICPNDTFYRDIHVYSNQVKIFVPNAFSPNGDTLNDVFDISGFAFKSYSIDIFNRWGEHIFHHATNLSLPISYPGSVTSGKGWDGNYNGLPADVGMYVYQVDVIDINGQHHHLNGTVNLLR